MDANVSPSVPTYTEDICSECEGKVQAFKKDLMRRRNVKP